MSEGVSRGGTKGPTCSSWFRIFSICCPLIDRPGKGTGFDRHWLEMIGFDRGKHRSIILSLVVLEVPAEGGLGGTAGDPNLARFERA